jgi:hypothetical protein
MAINFGRMIQGVATGAMGQYNAEVAAKDKMKGEIIQRAGLNFYENTLPEFEKKEKSRKETYDKLSQRFGPDVAEYFGQNFITGDVNDYKNILIELGDNPEIKADKLKQYLKATDSSYTKRAESRFNAIKEREKTIMGLTTGDSKIGTMTAQLQIPESTPIAETTEEVVTPAIEPQQIEGTPIMTSGTPEKTEMKTTALPTYEEIFGDGKEKVERNFFNLKREDVVSLKGDFDKEYKTKYLNPITGLREDTKRFKEDYDNLPDAEKAEQTLGGYVYNRHFRENYLPSVGYTYGTASAQPEENSFVKSAKYTINILKTNDPNDPAIDEIKADLKERLGTNDLSPYGL